MYVRLPSNIATLLLKHSNWRKTPRLVFTRAPGGYTAFLRGNIHGTLTTLPFL